MSTSKVKKNIAGSGATSVAPDLVKAGFSQSFVDRFAGPEEESERDYAGAAMTIATNALAVRAKSRGELAAQLKRRGIPLDVAENVLDRLERSKLIDDLEFARVWSRTRLS